MSYGCVFGVYYLTSRLRKTRLQACEKRHVRSRQKRAFFGERWAASIPCLRLLRLLRRRVCQLETPGPSYFRAAASRRPLGEIVCASFVPLLATSLVADYHLPEQITVTPSYRPLTPFSWLISLGGDFSGSLGIPLWVMCTHPPPARRLVALCVRSPTITED